MNAVVLASGGLDSTVTAAVAKRDGYDLYFLTIDYGQRHRIEIDRAREIARALGVVHHVVLDLDLRAFGGSALTDQHAVPKDRTAGERREGIPITYVPARNTIFLSLALAFAETLRASSIYFGANALDYSGYPDCRPEFMLAFEAVARTGTHMGTMGHSVVIRTPLLHKSKAQIIEMGVELNVPFYLTHSCYDPVGNGVACGRCDSCLIRREGFRRAGVVDPIQYAII
ncbi:MAG: 7-cyano-7-deazaguanine synthase QueC [Nitrospiraceae bacterium]